MNDNALTAGCVIRQLFANRLNKNTWSSYVSVLFTAPSAGPNPQVGLKKKR